MTGMREAKSFRALKMEGKSEWGSRAVLPWERELKGFHSWGGCGRRWHGTRSWEF